MDSEQLIKEGFQNYSLSLTWVHPLGVGHYFRTHRERAKLKYESYIPAHGFQRTE